MPQKDWIQLISTGLWEWKHQQYLRAQSLFFESQDALADQADGAVWRCFVWSSLSRLQSVLGDYRESEISLSEAKSIYASEKYAKRLQEIRPHLAYYGDLCETAELADEAALFHQSAERGEPYFLGVEMAATPFDARTTRQYAGVEESNFQMPTLAVGAKSAQLDGNWEDLLREGLSRGVTGQAMPMASALSQARSLAQKSQAKDQGLKLFLSTWIEVLAYYSAGDYSHSDRCRMDLEQLWLALSLQRGLEQRAELVYFCQLLNDFDFGYLADSFLIQLSQSKFPGLNPWTDLKARLESAKELDHDELHNKFSSTIRRGLGAIARDSGLMVPSDFADNGSELHVRSPELELELQGLRAGLERRLKNSKSLESGAALAVLLHVQSHVAWARGVGNEGRRLESEADELWSCLAPEERQTCWFAATYVWAVEDVGLHQWLADFPNQFYRSALQESTMNRYAPQESEGLGFSSALGSADGPKPTFWAQLEKALDCLLSQDYLKSERWLEECRRISLGQPDLLSLLALVHNVQANVSHLQGDPGESERCMQLAREGWKSKPISKLDLDSWLDLLERLNLTDQHKSLKARQLRGEAPFINPGQDLGSDNLRAWGGAAAPVLVVPSEPAKTGEPGGLKRMLGWFKKG